MHTVSRRAAVNLCLLRIPQKSGYFRTLAPGPCGHYQASPAPADWLAPARTPQPLLSPLPHTLPWPMGRHPPVGARGQPLPWAQLGLAWPWGPWGLLWPWEGQGAPQACWGSPAPGLPPCHGVWPRGAPCGSHTVADRRFGFVVMGVFVESHS